MLVANKKYIRVGTRGSPLARSQAGLVIQQLCNTHDINQNLCELVVIPTSGDKLAGDLSGYEGIKGLFTKELDEALLSGTIDLAVHSMKDVPTAQSARLSIAAILQRDDPRDAFLSHTASSINTLGSGAVVGTSSVRRRALLLWQRPDLQVIPFRGNIHTRLNKLERGEVDATLLANAGLKRLGLAKEATAVLSAEEMPPSAAQGAIGIGCRDDDSELKMLVEAINDPHSTAEVHAERALLSSLDGSCQTPIAALAILKENNLWLRATIIQPDGSIRHDGERNGTASDAYNLGHDLGAELRERGGSDFFSVV